MKLHRLSIVFILIFAFLLRIWGITSWFPYSVTGDEFESQYQVFVIAARGISALYPGYAILSNYVQLFLFVIAYLCLLAGGVVKNTQQYFQYFLHHKEIFLFSSRIIYALISSALIGVVWQQAVKFINHKKGYRFFRISAAWLLATSFLAVIQGRHIKDDTLVALLTFCSFLLSLRLSSFWSGMFLGIAAAAKYYPIGMLPANLWLLAFERKKLKGRWRRYFIGLGLGFILANPSLIFTPQRFLTGFLALASYLSDDFVLQYGLARFLDLTKDMLWEGWGALPFLFSVLGIILILKDAKKNRILAAAVVAFFGLYASLLVSGGLFARYGLLLLPFFALFAAYTIIKLQARLFLLKNPVVFLILIIVLSSQNLERTAKFNHISTMIDTREIARTWIERHLTENVVIVNEGYQVNFGLPQTGVYLYPSENQFVANYQKSRKLQQPNFFISVFQKQSAGHRRFTVVATGQITHRWDDMLGQWVKEKSPDWFDTADFVVTSSWSRPQRLLSRNFETEFVSKWEVLRTFSAVPQLKFDPYNWQSDWEGIDQVNLLKHDLIFGPQITVYKKKG